MGVNILLNVLAQLTNKTQVYLGDGAMENVFCQFNNPANSNQIEDFEKTSKCTLPHELKEFFLITNGITLFRCDCYIHDLHLMQGIIDSGIYPEGIYSIGYVNGDTIIINSSEISSERYIYAGPADSVDEFKKLNCNFCTFLDRLVLSNGQDYWNWFSFKEYLIFQNERSRNTAEQQGIQ